MNHGISSTPLHRHLPRKNKLTTPIAPIGNANPIAKTRVTKSTSIDISHRTNVNENTSAKTATDVQQGATQPSERLLTTKQPLHFNSRKDRENAAIQIPRTSERDQALRTTTSVSTKTQYRITELFVPKLMQTVDIDRRVAQSLCNLERFPKRGISLQLVETIDGDHAILRLAADSRESERAQWIRIASSVGVDTTNLLISGKQRAKFGNQKFQLSWSLIESLTQPKALFSTLRDDEQIKTAIDTIVDADAKLQRFRYSTSQPKRWSEVMAQQLNFYGQFLEAHGISANHRISDDLAAVEAASRHQLIHGNASPDHFVIDQATGKTVLLPPARLTTGCVEADIGYLLARCWGTSDRLDPAIAETVKLGLNRFVVRRAAIATLVLMGGEQLSPEPGKKFVFNKFDPNLVRAKALIQAADELSGLMGLSSEVVHTLARHA